MGLHILHYHFLSGFLNIVTILAFHFTVKEANAFLEQ
jgi:hypothetical protein